MEKDRYHLIDSGDGKKLEQFGPYILERPCSQAIWKMQLPKSWQKKDATFTRDDKEGWTFYQKIPKSWVIHHQMLKFKLMLTDFGHLGLFPEHSVFWQWIQNKLKKEKKPPQVLNLFAYSGGATLASLKAGAHVCHLDASKGMVSWAKENATLNGLEKSPTRWIVDDAIKFLKREIKRKRKYDAIILDPPTFGRGAKGEVFKIEKDLPILLKSCVDLLSDNPLFILLTCHTPGYTPLALSHLLHQMTEHLKGTIDSGEMAIEARANSFSIPSGCFARWTCG